MPYGNVFQGNLDRRPYGPAAGGPAWNMGNDIRRPPSNPTPPPMPPVPPRGRIMDGPGSGFTFPGNGGMSPFAQGRAQSIPEPSQGTPYGGPRMSDDSDFNFDHLRGKVAPSWDMGDDIRRVPDSRPAPTRQPPPHWNMGDDVRRVPGNRSASPYGQPDTSWQPDPDEYRRSIAAEQRRAAEQDRELAARRQKAQAGRKTYDVPGYDRPVSDPVVAQNEYDRIAREQRAAARGDKPRKTQLELDMELRNQEHDRIVKQRSQVQSALPDLDQATQNAIRQRMNAYGETPEEAYQNGGFAARQQYARDAMNDGIGRSERVPVGRSRWR